MAASVIHMKAMNAYNYIIHYLSYSLFFFLLISCFLLLFVYSIISWLLFMTCVFIAVNKHSEVKAELLDLEDLLFETMDELWRSRIPAAIEGGPYLLDPLKIMSMFVHLAKFFEATDKALHEEACLIIIRIPTFLYLVANVMAKQIEGKAHECYSTHT